MDYTIIDAHAHLWLKQDTVVEGKSIKTIKMGDHSSWGGATDASSVYG